MADPEPRCKLVFVATTPFAVNAFLRTHLLVFAETYDVCLCVNTLAYPLVEEIRQRVRVVHIDIERKVMPLRDVRALYQLWRFLRRERPEVVHSMTPKAGLLAMLAGCSVSIPQRFHTFTGQVWATKAGLARGVLKQLDRLIAACASSVFADSQSQCRVLEKEGVVKPGGVSVLGAGSVAGVDLERFRPDFAERAAQRGAIGLDDGAPVFLFVGRLVRDKGVFDLINAFSVCAKPGWELWMVGPDESGLQPELQQLGSSMGSTVRWFGATLHPERFMMAADIFVLPSSREGFGSVIIEAAACALPSVAYRVEGVVDAIVDQQTGRLVDWGDVLALAREMEALGSNVAERRKLGLAAQERTRNSFSSQAVSQAWLDFYAQALTRADSTM